MFIINLKFFILTWLHIDWLGKNIDWVCFVNILQIHMNYIFWTSQSNLVTMWYFSSMRYYTVIVLCRSEYEDLLTRKMTYCLRRDVMWHTSTNIKLLTKILTVYGVLYPVKENEINIFCINYMPLPFSHMW